MSFISKQRPLSESDNAQDIADDEELFDIEVCNFFFNHDYSLFILVRVALV
jgi:hypothetical protein